MELKLKNVDDGGKTQEAIDDLDKLMLNHLIHRTFLLFYDDLTEISFLAKAHGWTVSVEGKVVE